MVDAMGDVAEELFLIRKVMERFGFGRRVVDAMVVVQVGDSEIVLQASRRAAKLQAWVDGIVAAAIERQLGAVQLGAFLGGDVDNAGRPIAKLGRVPVTRVTDSIRWVSTSWPKPLRLSGSRTPFIRY